MVKVNDVVGEIQGFVRLKCQKEIGRLTYEFPRNADFYVSFRELTKYSLKLSDYLYDNFEEFSQDCVSALKDEARGISWNDTLRKNDRDPPEVVVRVVEVTRERKKPIRSLRSVDLYKFVSVEGIVRKVSEIRSEVVSATYFCRGCNRTIKIDQRHNDALVKPERCPECGVGKSYLVEKKSKHEYKDIQRLVIQETPEGLGGGQQPKQMDVRLEGGLVGDITAGNRVVVNGVVVPIQTQKKGKVNAATIDGNTIEKEEDDYSDLTVSIDEETEFKALSKLPNLVDLIVDSISPSIYGHRDVKLGFSCALFGGVAKDLGDGTRIRGDSHILACGDAGIAKSKMMKTVSNICPRSVYASGKSSSGVGLTATVVRDEMDGRWTLEAGAAVLADGGVLILDELDKMNEDDRSAMHQVMEDQEITINKAGVNATLKTRCGVIAACNPKTGRFSDYDALSDQLDLPPSLISRFDLVYAIRDIPETKMDENIANHILSRGNEIKTDNLLSPDTLRKYIAYSKRINPVMDEATGKLLGEYYVSIREKSKERVTITPRQLEGLVRLSESFARMRLSETVTPVDVNNAIRLFDGCMRNVAFDSDSNSFDIDKLVTKNSGKGRELSRVIGDLINSQEGGMKRDYVIATLNTRGITPESVNKMVDKMLNESALYEPKRGLLRVM